MSLIQQFKLEAEVLNHADHTVASSRLAGLLDWMESQPEIKTILEKLRSTRRAQELLEQVGVRHPPQARNQEEVAAVGLALAEACKEGELWKAAFAWGIFDSHQSGTPRASTARALREYVEPFLNYVLRQLPPEESPQTRAGQFLQPAIPVAIQESLENSGRITPTPKRLASS